MEQENGKAATYRMGMAAPAEPDPETEALNSALRDAGFTEAQRAAMGRLFWTNYFIAEDSQLPAAMRKAFYESLNEERKQGSTPDTFRYAVEMIFDRKIDDFFKRLTDRWDRKADKGYSKDPIHAFHAWIADEINGSERSTFENARRILEGGAFDGYIESGSTANEILRMLEAAVHRFRNETARMRARRIARRLTKKAHSAAVKCARSNDKKKKQNANLEFRMLLSEFTVCMRGMDSKHREGTIASAVDDGFTLMLDAYSAIPKEKWDKHGNDAPLLDSNAHNARRDFKRAAKRLAARFCEMQEGSPAPIPLPDH